MTRREVVRDYGGVSAGDRRDDRRRRLVAAGRRIWGDSGIGDVTVRGTAREAGLAYRYFYEHFPNRDALIVAVADEVRTELVTTLIESSVEAGGGTEQQLRVALRAFLSVIADDPQMFRIMTSDDAGVEGLDRRRRDTLDLVAEAVVANLAEQSDAAETDLRRTARFAVGGVYRLMETWLVERDVEADELADICTRLAMSLTTVRRS
ncbi:TetR/AcrR family transcriptional regulator [Gordonia liuliyuniae]|uniref:TetR/AcrR family transcriptional regulator n=1 Tax=Gordonia liuliyuniae TaxID=2911517 RepID=A0ABS9IQM2_9ACTN|nr:TetR/AcrR family transcriptional regulator [Gordonia liuliyuniae]MCF8587858.1 TetR/AcrR family transcriptional regulator [Gordonia liuliyuniae]